MFAKSLYTVVRCVVLSDSLLLGARSRGVRLGLRVDVVLRPSTGSTAGRRVLLVCDGLVERRLLVLGVVRLLALGENTGLALLALLNELRLVEELVTGKRVSSRCGRTRATRAPWLTLPLIFSSVPLSWSAMPLLPAYDGP